MKNSANALSESFTLGMYIIGLMPVIRFSESPDNNNEIDTFGEGIQLACNNLGISIGFNNIIFTMKESQNLNGFLHKSNLLDEILSKHGSMALAAFQLGLKLSSLPFLKKSESMFYTVLNEIKRFAQEAGCDTEDINKFQELLYEDDNEVKRIVKELLILLPNRLSQIDQLKSKKIFIVHGHDEAKKYELKSFLTTLGVKPIILHEEDDCGLTIIEKFERYAGECSFAFVLLTPDDIVKANDDSEDALWRARQNVLLELGWFMAKLGRQRVVVLHKGKVEIPSDLLGVIYLPFSHSIMEISEKIRQRLQGVNLI